MKESNSNVCLKNRIEVEFTKIVSFLQSLPSKILISALLFHCLYSLKCVDKTKPAETSKGFKSPEVVLTIASLGTDARLPCHFCREKESITGRIWRRKSLRGEEREVELDMHDDDSKNRVFVAEDHSLIIRNISIKDGAYYFCYDVENKAGSPKMDILLDVGYRTPLEPVVLNMPVNLDVEIPKHLKNCEKLKTIPVLSMYRCYVEWGQWSNCDNCGRLAERRKVGECRLQKFEKSRVESHEGRVIEADFPIVGVGCHSYLLNDIPRAKEILSEIPNLVLIEKCEVPCDNYFKKAKKLSAFRRSSYLKKIKMKISEKMRTVSKDIKAEIKKEKAGTGITLICPGASLDIKVKWKFKEKLMKPDILRIRSAGRVYIDATDALHIKSLRNRDAGEYICTLLGVEIGIICLKVVSTHTAFDPTSNFGLFTIGMTISFIIWFILMRIKWRVFMKQRKVQQNRQNKLITNTSLEENENSNLLQEESSSSDSYQSNIQETESKSTIDTEELSSQENKSNIQV